jgi:hypothetical protein
MSMHIVDGRSLTDAEFIRYCVNDELEGERTPAQTYEGKALVRVGDVLMTQETAAELAQEAA